MRKIKQKRTLILFSIFGLLALIAITPSILGYSGTVVPDEIIITHGSQEGSRSYLYTKNDGYTVTWTSAYLGWFQHKIDLKVCFPIKSDVGTGNTVEIRFEFTGGNVLDVKIVYTDGTYDLDSENSASFKTIIYELVNYKIVDYVEFFNHEFWADSVLEVDYLVVNY